MPQIGDKNRSDDGDKEVMLSLGQLFMLLENCTEERIKSAFKLSAGMIFSGLCVDSSSHKMTKYEEVDLVMGEKKKYSMLVFSNATEGMEEEYLTWYAGQHIHDLLRIPGYVGCKFYKIADTQLSDGPQQYRHLIIWDFETDDFAAVCDDIRARMKDGRTVFCPAFDKNYLDVTVTPITKYVTSEEIKGKTVDEVLAISKLDRS
jgi:hypothetical protein